MRVDCSRVGEAHANHFQAAQRGLRPPYIPVDAITHSQRRSGEGPGSGDGCTDYGPTDGAR